MGTTIERLQQRAGFLAWRGAARRAVVPLGAVALWEVVTRAGWIDHLILPAFSEVLQALAKGIASGELFDHLRPSLLRALSGFLIAVVVAVPMGMCVGWSARAREYLGSLLELLRPVPPITIVPLALLWFGIGSASKVFVIAYACFWSILINTMLGVTEINPLLIRAARVMGIHGFDFFRKILLPAALPKVFAGMRISTGVALIVLVASEMVGAPNGIGYLIIDAERTFRTAEMFAGIIVISVLGLVLNGLLTRLESVLFQYGGRP